ncbi:hypothetical protein DLAC_11576 [Tieghemostelium lacteum]|uniref:Uncharacterized protein n=1 Tax=Tieghemostelium lacteum TaxID=361077 RepID=A0A151ZSE7_TIELA|nr:hypothetical protein DLAC_11576 [Tieghemostelium lacteum]|eukprot:KYQ96836.1 hypothetical protein DLAC_11576 [Tieghemostelium lacteum]
MKSLTLLTIIVLFINITYGISLPYLTGIDTEVDIYINEYNYYGSLPIWYNVTSLDGINPNCLNTSIAERCEYTMAMTRPPRFDIPSKDWTLNITKQIITQNQTFSNGPYGSVDLTVGMTQFQINVKNYFYETSNSKLSIIICSTLRLDNANVSSEIGSVQAYRWNELSLGGNVTVFKSRYLYYYLEDNVVVLNSFEEFTGLNVSNQTKCFASLLYGQDSTKFADFILVDQNNGSGSDGSGSGSSSDSTSTTTTTTTTTTTATTTTSMGSTTTSPDSPSNSSTLKPIIFTFSLILLLLI